MLTPPSRAQSDVGVKCGRCFPCGFQGSPRLSKAFQGLQVELWKWVPSLEEEGEKCVVIRGWLYQLGRRLRIGSRAEAGSSNSPVVWSPSHRDRQSQSQSQTLIMIHRKQSVYHCLVGLLASFIVAVNAGPITTEPVHSVAEDTFSSAVPYEFPDDYSISLEQAVVSWDWIDFVASKIC